MTRYRIEERIAGRLWQIEPGGERYRTREEAEQVMARLETTNDDGEPMEYRVVEES